MVVTSRFELLEQKYFVKLRDVEVNEKQYTGSRNF